MKVRVTDEDVEAALLLIIHTYASGHPLHPKDRRDCLLLVRHALEQGVKLETMIDKILIIKQKGHGISDYNIALHIKELYWLKDFEGKSATRVIYTYPDPPIPNEK